MKRLFIIIGFSAVLYLALVSPSITIDFWQKVLHKKEPSKESKNKDRVIMLILWALLTGVLAFVVFAFWEG